MKRILLGAALTLSVSATQALAGPNWDQLSLSYLSVSVDDEEITGFGLSGSKLLNSNFFLAGGYSSLSEDVAYSVDAELNSLSLGLGVRKAVANNTDVFGIVSYENVEVALSSGFSSLSLGDVDGYSLQAGFRTMFTPKFELGGAVSYADFDGADETGFNIGAAYYFTPQFAVGAGYGTAEDVDTFSLTGIMNF